MEHDHIRAGLTKPLHIAMRLCDHQVHIQKHLSALPNGLDHRNTDRDIRYKYTIHHIDMKIICASCLHLRDIIPERAEIGRKNRWRYLDHSSFLLKSDVIL